MSKLSNRVSAQPAMLIARRFLFLNEPFRAFLAKAFSKSKYSVAKVVISSFSNSSLSYRIICVIVDLSFVNPYCYGAITLYKTSYSLSNIRVSSTFEMQFSMIISL